MLRYGDLLYDGLMMLVGLYALRRGGWPERVGVLIACLGTGAMAAAALAGWQPPEHGVPLADLAMLAAFLALALRSDRFWPIWCTGFAAAEVAVHAARPLMAQGAPLGSWRAVAIWGYLCLVAMALGTRFEARRDRAAVTGG